MEKEVEKYIAYSVQIYTGSQYFNGWESYCKSVDNLKEAKRLQAKAKRKTGCRTKILSYESNRYKD